MRDDLLRYYEQELASLRGDLADQFARQHPKIAQQLSLERNKCDDPHVERMIEACALLAARVRLKLDDDFPQLAEALLQVLYPHYLAPVPSMSIVQFTLDPDQGKSTAGYRIDRNRTLLARRTQDTICRFRTCYPTTVWPLQVESVRMDSGVSDGSGRTAPAAITIKLRTIGDLRLSELELDSLRFYLDGDGAFVNRLYELLMAHCYRLEVRAPDGGPVRAPIVLPPGSLGEVGFGHDEGMLPYSQRSFLGYRLVQEYFQFPQKFFFVDVKHLKALRGTRFAHEALLVLYLDEPSTLTQALRPDHFRLGCTPVINLFSQPAESISVKHTQTEYQVIPDHRRKATTEVYSIDRVSSAAAPPAPVVEYQPFYSFKHAAGGREPRTFWHASRRPSTIANDPGTEVFITLVDLDFRLARPPVETLSVQVTCLNRDLPGKLPFGNAGGDFDIEGGAPISRATALVKPTNTLRPPLGRGLQWRLVSQLSLNYLSAVGNNDGSPEALREILRLYDFSHSAAVEQEIAGLTRVSSRPVIRRIRTAEGSGFARGIEATLEFDESRFVGSGPYMFSSILEKFLGLYVSVNSFSQMVARSSQRGETPIRVWPPRSGEQVLL